MVMTVTAIFACSQNGCAQQTQTNPDEPENSGFQAIDAAGKRDPGTQRAADSGRTLEDWPTFLGPRGDGTSAETGIDPTRWDPVPPLLWSIELGTSYGAPAVVEEKLYQFDRHGDDERLTCYETATGKEIWQWNSRVSYSDSFGYNNGPRCSPVIDDDRVYVYGVAGQLSCVDRNSGKLVWTKDLAREYQFVQNFFGVASTPAVFEELLLVMVGGSPSESQGKTAYQLDQVRSDGTAIVAFNKQTGDEVYRVGDDLASYASLVVRNINGAPTGLAFLRSGLLGFDARSGIEKFTFPWRASKLESVNAALPVTDKGRIFLSECYEIGSVLLKLNENHLEVVWQDEGPWPPRDLSFRAHWSTPVLIDGFLYGCNGRNGPDTDFRCVKFDDGQVQWRDRNRKRGRTSVLVVDGYLIVLGEFGMLQLVKPDPSGFKVVREADLGRMTGPDRRPFLQSPCWAAPVLSRGKLYLRGSNRLACFQLIDLD